MSLDSWCTTQGICQQKIKLIFQQQIDCQRQQLSYSTDCFQLLQSSKSCHCNRQPCSQAQLQSPPASQQQLPPSQPQLQSPASQPYYFKVLTNQIKAGPKIRASSSQKANCF